MIERVTVDGYEFACDYGEPDCIDDVRARHAENDDNVVCTNCTDGDFFDTSEGYAIREKAFAEFARLWPSVRDELSENLEGRYDPIIDGDIKRSIESGLSSVNRERSAA